MSFASNTEVVLTAAVIPATPAPIIATFVLLHALLRVWFASSAAAALAQNGGRLATRSTMFLIFKGKQKSDDVCNSVEGASAHAGYLYLSTSSRSVSRLGRVPHASAKVEK